jgi:hypothetical protein
MSAPAFFVGVDVGAEDLQPEPAAHHDVARFVIRDVLDKGRSRGWRLDWSALLHQAMMARTVHPPSPV